MAQEGGIGIIHKNMSAEARRAEVAKVKRFESGVVQDPITVTPDMTVRDVIELTRTAQDFRRCRWSKASWWSASSPIAICASRSAWTSR